MDTRWTDRPPSEEEQIPGGQVRDRIVELVRVRPGDLRPNPRNWRRHLERQQQALRGLLAQIGYADALLARRDGEALVLVDGHLRQSLDPEQLVPVLVLDVDEREADLLLASLDPLAALATPDPQALGPAGAGADLERRGGAAAGRSGPAGRGGARARALRSRCAPRGPRAPVRAGDLWQLGEQRLLCADATDPAHVGRLMAGERADVVWTDPPYGVGYVGKTPEALRITGDARGGVAELLRAAFAAAGPALAEGAVIYLAHPSAHTLTFLQAFTQAGWRLHQVLVWVKDRMVLGTRTTTTGTSRSPSGTRPGAAGGAGGKPAGTGPTTWTRCSSSSARPYNVEACNGGRALQRRSVAAGFVLDLRERSGSVVEQEVPQGWRT